MPKNDVSVSLGKVGIGEEKRLSTLTVTAKASFDLSGTVAKSNGSATLTGTATEFLTEVGLGDRVRVPGGAQETKTVIAIASDMSLTVDSNFENDASGKTAKGFPSTARFQDSGGNNPVIVSDQTRVGIGTLVPQSPLHIHSSESAANLLVFSNDELGLTGGMAVFLAVDPRALEFRATDSESTVFSINPESIGFQTGIMVPTRFKNSNTTLVVDDHTVYVDAGSGGVTITLPPLAGGLHEGRIYYVFKFAGAGDVEVAPDGSDLINGVNASKTLSTQYSGMRLFATNGSGWVAATLSAA